MLYKVLTSAKSPGISQGLTYESDQDLPIGQAVRVPLRNRTVEGIVLALEEQKKNQEFDLKQIHSCLGDQPLLTKAQLKTLQWMSSYYCCSLRQALRVWLPSGPWDNLLPQEQTFYRSISTAIPRGKKQQEVLDQLKHREWVPADTLKRDGVSQSVLSNMVDKKLIESKTVIEEVKNTPITLHKDGIGKLNQSQKKALDTLCATDKPALLFGVTGSGKTEIYVHLIAETIQAGKQAILLVPEILLTEHIIHRFEKLLDREQIAVVHSKLTPSARRSVWRDIHAGRKPLIIGSRSALFSPAQNLGLVIIDEEHEWTYKNEQTPRYHARETAQTLCRHANAKLVLGTATPSLESWSKAKSKQYTLARLDNRYLDAAMPHVRVIDLATVEFGDLYPFSPPLLEAISDRLQKGEQSVLFLNRRGTASALLCLDCRRRIVSPESQMPFTLHTSAHGKGYLVDHTTGVTIEVPTTCPGCQSVRLHPVGAGTQKIESILEKKFPSARLLRADKDTLKHPEHMRLLLKKMREGQADILLGTQSVVKGLDLPNVTLAAVLIADVGLSLPHFRAGERIFQLLTQLTGRSGRTKPGEVIIQTFRPDAPEVVLSSEHRTQDYLEQEWKLRMHALYPPATTMIRLIVRGDDPATRARALCDALRQRTTETETCISAAPTLFGGGKVWHVLLRGSELRPLLAQIDLQDITIDIDPIECL